MVMIMMLMVLLTFFYFFIWLHMKWKVSVSVYYFIFYIHLQWFCLLFGKYQWHCMDPKMGVFSSPFLHLMLVSFFFLMKFFFDGGGCLSCTSSGLRHCLLQAVPFELLCWLTWYFLSSLKRLIHCGNLTKELAWFIACLVHVRSYTNFLRSLF